MSRIVIGPSLVRLFTLHGAAFLTSALSSPGWVTATRVTGSTVISRIRSVLGTIPPSTALDPPDNKVLPVTNSDAAEEGASQRYEIATSRYLSPRRDVAQRGRESANRSRWLLI